MLNEFKFAKIKFILKNKTILVNLIKDKKIHIVWLN